MTEKMKEKLMMHRIKIPDDETLSDDDILDLALFETMKASRETSDKLSSVLKMMKFFYILGIISLVGSALYLIVTLANLAG